MNLALERALLWRFMRAPASLRGLERPDAGTAVRLCAAVTVLLWVVYAVVVPITGLVAEFFDAEHFADTHPLPARQELVLALIWAPVAEELVFRLWMRWPRLLPLCMGGFVLFAALTASSSAASFDAIGFAALFGAVGTWVWLRSRPLGSGYDQWVDRNFNALVWGSIALFAGVHLSNWQVHEVSPVLLLLVLPQLAAGVMISFVCLRAGFLAAVGLHFANNLSALFVQNLFGP
jgi:hypothetical protein